MVLDPDAILRHVQRCLQGGETEIDLSENEIFECDTDECITMTIFCDGIEVKFEYSWDDPMTGEKLGLLTSRICGLIKETP